MQQFGELRVLQQRGDGTYTRQHGAPALLPRYDGHTYDQRGQGEGDEGGVRAEAVVALHGRGAQRRPAAHEHAADRADHDDARSCWGLHLIVGRIVRGGHALQSLVILQAGVALGWFHVVLLAGSRLPRSLQQRIGACIAKHPKQGEDDTREQEQWLAASVNEIRQHRAQDQGSADTDWEGNGNSTQRDARREHQVCDTEHRSGSQREEDVARVDEAWAAQLHLPEPEPEDQGRDHGANAEVGIVEGKVHCATCGLRRI
mmetsp:Transcript_16460/g.42510  ORF Transcript_16460/g.42510 Transcript_16460/m.42510 type:complete len:259 (+) Transcript_16460:540-1316(+)